MSRWRPGAIPKAKGCLLFVAVIVTHFTFSRKGLDFSGKRVNKRVCVCYYAKHRDVLEKLLCSCVWSTVNAVLFFFPRLLFGCGRCLRDGAYAIYFVPFHVFVSSCSIPMLYVGLRVFISLYWFPVGWAEFLTPFPAVVDNRHLVPRLQRLDSAWRSVVSLLATTAWFVIGSFGGFFWVFLNPSYCDSVFVDKWGQDLSVRTSS